MRLLSLFFVLSIPIPRDLPTKALLLRLPALALEHLFLCPLRSLPLLPTDLLDSVFFGLYDSFLEFLDSVEEQTPCEESVQSLGALPLAFDAEPRGDVHELHAARGLVDFLTPRAG